MKISILSLVSLLIWGSSSWAVEASTLCSTAKGDVVVQGALITIDSVPVAAGDVEVQVAELQLISTEKRPVPSGSTHRSRTYLAILNIKLKSKTSFSARRPASSLSEVVICRTYFSGS